MQRLDNGKVGALICQNVEQNRALAQAGRAQVAIKIIANNYRLAGGAINLPQARAAMLALSMKQRLGGPFF